MLGRDGLWLVRPFLAHEGDAVQRALARTHAELEEKALEALRETLREVG